MLKALIIGMGSIGLRHMRSLITLEPTVHLDVLRASGRQDIPAGFPSVSISLSLEEALAKKPDLMVIANPTALHLKYLLVAMREKIPFYAEKPLVASIQELRSLISEIENTSLPPNIVGCNLRFLPSLKKLRDLIQQGSIGRVVRASFEAGQWLPDWRPASSYRTSYSARPELGGGVLLDLIHEIDAARWIFGDFNLIKGITGQFSSLEIETEDVAALLLSREGGPLVSVQLDYISRVPVRISRIVGEQGTLEWDLPRRQLRGIFPEGEHQIETESHAFDVSATYITAMAELLNAVKEKRRTIQPLQEGIQALNAVFSIHPNVVK